MTLLAALDRPATRYRLYAVLALCLFTAGVGLNVVKANQKNATFSFIYGDGRGYYIYLPSVLLDHTLDLAPRMSSPAYDGPELRRYLAPGPNARGYVRNAQPTGIALTIAPAFLGAHGLSKAAYALTNSPRVYPDGATLLYQLLCPAFIMALGAAGLVLVDRVIAERYHLPGRYIALAILAYWLGSNYAWYYVRDVFHHPVVETFWVCVIVYLAHATLRDLDAARLPWWRPPALAFALAMALACRPTNAALFPVFLYLLWRIVRTRQLRRALVALPLALLCLFPAYLQAFVQRQLAPTPKAQTIATAPATQPDSPMGSFGYRARERFYWDRPALLKILYSSRNGLFFWSPILLFAIAGLAVALWRGPGRDGLLLGLAGYALLLWYINASWYAWWFGESYGQRVAVCLAPLFITGLAFAFTAIATLSYALRCALGALAALFVLWNALLMLLFMLPWFPRGDYLFVQKDGHWTLNRHDRAPRKTQVPGTR